MLGESFLQSLKRATCFDRDSEVGPRMFDDAIQSRAGENKIRAHGRVAPTEFGAATSRNDNEFCFVGEAKSCRKFLFPRWFEDELRLDSRDGVSGSCRTELACS